VQGIDLELQQLPLLGGQAGHPLGLVELGGRLAGVVRVVVIVVAPAIRGLAGGPEEGHNASLLDFLWLRTGLGGGLALEGRHGDDGSGGGKLMKVGYR